MKKDVRTRTVKYNVYVAKDGKEFDSENECKHYEMILDDTRKVCPECHGKGVVIKEYEYDNYHSGVPETSIFFPTCTKCNGKGYLEKKIKEVWE